MTSLGRKEGVSAPCNIVSLPTAAPRKVDNFRYAEQRRAVIAARTGNRWSARSPSEARQLAGTKRQKTATEGVERTPALLIAMAMLDAADENTKAKVYATVFQAAMRCDCETTAQTFGIVQAIARKREVK